MSKYISNISEILAGVLDRATRAQPEQFAGYWANIDFWIAEYEHLVAIAAGYDQRINAMKAAYDQHIREHGGPHNFDDCGKPYQRVKPSKRGDRKEAVRAVKEALDRVVERAHRMGMIDFDERDRLSERVKVARQGAGL